MAMYSAKLHRKRGDVLRLVPGGAPRRGGARGRPPTRPATGRDLLHYQPIVDAGSGSTVGYEALARWTHPERGEIRPADFIPAAERSGLVVELGNSMLEQACRWASARDATFAVSVNISPTHAAWPGFFESVEATLDATGLEPHRLRLELTEHARLVDAEEVVATLQSLSRKGVHIDLDDFGTGYSAIDLLVRLPVSAIKLNRSLIASVSSDSRRLHVIRHLVELAHSLDARVTAEGIETSDEWSAIRAQRVDFAQGFLFGRPAALH